MLVTALNGVAEELFFRGAVVRRHPRATRCRSPPSPTTAVTLATGNVMLALRRRASLGAVVGLQRRASGGILAPILTHVTWSVAMLYALPAIFL